MCSACALRTVSSGGVVGQPSGANTGCDRSWAIGLGGLVSGGVVVGVGGVGGVGPTVVGVGAWVVGVTDVVGVVVVGDAWAGAACSAPSATTRAAAAMRDARLPAPCSPLFRSTVPPG